MVISDVQGLARFLTISGRCCGLMMMKSDDSRLDAFQNLSLASWGLEEYLPFERREIGLIPLIGINSHQLVVIRGHAASRFIWKIYGNRCRRPQRKSRKSCLGA